MKFCANPTLENIKNLRTIIRNLRLFRKFAKQNGQVVTKSDKGNNIVILDESSYYTKGYQFFSGEGFLKSFDNNEKEFKLLKSFLLELKHSGSIDQTFYKVVTPENFRPPIPYFLAKTQTGL